MKVWVIRHGESVTNRDGLWTGWYDAALTEKGKQDATLAREYLSKVKFDKIYSSDLQRARNTAEIAIPGCVYETDASLREVNVGDIAGKPLAAMLESEPESRCRLSVVRMQQHWQKLFSEQVVMRRDWYI